MQIINHSGSKNALDSEHSKACKLVISYIWKCVNIILFPTKNTKNVKATSKISKNTMYSIYESKLYRMPHDISKRLHVHPGLSSNIVNRNCLIVQMVCLSQWTSITQSSHKLAEMETRKIKQLDMKWGVIASSGFPLLSNCSLFLYESSPLLS
jgi:hypothetical protein